MDKKISITELCNSINESRPSETVMVVAYEKLNFYDEDSPVTLLEDMVVENVDMEVLRTGKFTMVNLDFATPDDPRIDRLIDIKDRFDHVYSETDYETAVSEPYLTFYIFPLEYDVKYALQLSTPVFVLPTKKPHTDEFKRIQIVFDTESLMQIEFTDDQVEDLRNTAIEESSETINVNNLVYANRNNNTGYLH